MQMAHRKVCFLHLAEAAGSRTGNCDHKGAEKTEEKKIRGGYKVLREESNFQAVLERRYERMKVFL